MRNLGKISGLLAVLAFCLPVSALVLHPGYEPPASWSGRPSSNVVGRWGSNGSCVVIAPDCVATTNHQGGGVGTAVVIGGQTYYVARVERDGSTDIRVAKLALAGLSEYIAPYTGTSEVGKEIVISGYGKSRGVTLDILGIAYGYTWLSESNTTLRWGTNKVDSIDTTSTPYTCLESDFDASGRRATDYEAVIAEYDSGGGCFMEELSEWKLVGLNYAVGPHASSQESWFSVSIEKQYAHRVSLYAAWMNTTATRLTACGNEPQDITEDCAVNIDDIEALAKWWASSPVVSLSRDRADIDDDAKVNMLDFAVIAANWNESYW